MNGERSTGSSIISSCSAKSQQQLVNERPAGRAMEAANLFPSGPHMHDNNTSRCTDLAQGHVQDTDMANSGRQTVEGLHSGAACVTEHTVLVWGGGTGPFC